MKNKPWCAGCPAKDDEAACAECGIPPPPRVDTMFGLRVAGRVQPLPQFFETESEASELRMRHSEHSPACLEVVEVAVQPVVRHKDQEGTR